MLRVLKTFAITFLLAAAAAPAQAQLDWEVVRDQIGGRGGGGTHSVPEFDPSAAGGIAAVLAGGAVLLARRRKHKR